jgi:polyisoprenoid-binding protein YceI
MKFKLTLLFMLMSLMTTASGMGLVYGKYKIDPVHTRVSFLISHFVVSQVEGRFNDVSGSFTLEEDASKSSVDVTIPVASIDTGVKKRDDHLKTPDFFEVRKYPTMTFKSKKFTGPLEDFKVTGDLTIKGVTKEVVLEGKYMGSIKDTWGHTRAAIKATGKINRRDFNIIYNDMIEAGPAVGDEVTINIISEGLQDKPVKKN